MYYRYEECLKEKGVTSYKVSKDTGISQSCLSDWKHGVSTPKSGKLLTLARYFDKPPEYFIKEEKRCQQLT